MREKAIGVFDSGLGGLTAVKELMKCLPTEDIVYFGDTGRVPYGSRSRETIIKYTMQDIRFLLERKIKMIIIACGTASSVALEHVRGLFPLPIIGVVDASADAALAATKNGRIGILGTSGTISSDVYQKKLKLAGGEPFGVPCPLFVPLVENGYIGHPATRLIAADYLKPLQEVGVDTIILGCTHYPLLKGVISDIMDHGTALIDSGAETAKAAALVLKERGLLNPGGGRTEFFVSDRIADFSRQGSLFLEQEIRGKVHQVDIERY